MDAATKKFIREQNAELLKGIDSRLVKIVDERVTAAVEDVSTVISDVMTGIERKLDAFEHKVTEEFKAVRRHLALVDGFTSDLYQDHERRLKALEGKTKPPRKTAPSAR
jgi:hypothetical protein